MLKEKRRERRRDVLVVGLAGAEVRLLNLCQGLLEGAESKVADEHPVDVRERLGELWGRGVELGGKSAKNVSFSVKFFFFFPPLSQKVSR